MFLTWRLNPLITPPVEKSPIMTLSLQEVLIVGSCSEQVKFSELTLDMFRMLQSLEREPQEDLVQMYDASPAPGRIPYVSRDSWVVAAKPLIIFRSPVFRYGHLGTWFEKAATIEDMLCINYIPSKLSL